MVTDSHWILFLHPTEADASFYVVFCGEVFFLHRLS